MTEGQAMKAFTAIVCVAAALVLAPPAHAQEQARNTVILNGGVPTETREVQMPPNASPASQAILNEGREQATKRHRDRHLRNEQHQQEIRDHSTGLENRVDAGDGAVSSSPFAGPAAMGSGARMSTPFNR
jgi:hypothetical protein